MNETLARFRMPLRQWFVWLLLTMVFAGFSAGELYRNLYAVTALLGIWILVRHWRDLKQDRRLGLLWIFFSAIWVPMVVALVDAHDFYRSARTTGRFLFYFFAAVALLHLLRDRRFSMLLLYTFFIIMVIITIDGLWQAITGHNILGYPFFRGIRITSFFYPSPTMPLFMAVFSPLYFEVVRRLMLRWKFSWLLLVPFTVVIVLGASRTGWVLYSVAALFYVMFRLYPLLRELRWGKIFLRSTIVVVIATAVMSQFSYIEKRAEVLAGLFSGDKSEIDTALSLRLNLWQTAIIMTRNHWFNGVGPRSYSSAYPEYANEGDPWVQQEVRQPHMTILEIMAETGLVGLVGYVLFLVLMGRLIWRTAWNDEESEAVPWGICVLVASFPLAASMPFYGFFWAQLVWFPLALFLAMLSPRPRKRPTESRQAEGTVAE